jgi:hypothetical protein
MSLLELGITFVVVVAPKDYDPVASGFYKPEGREDRTYYDSDEEESMDMRQQPQVNTGIEMSHQRLRF